MADQDFEVTGTLQIRPAVVEDASALQQYYFTNRSEAEIGEELQADLAREEVYRIVAVASGHAIGNIRLERQAHAPEIGEVSQLVVSAPFRQFGVADRLMEYTEGVARENGMTMLQIELSRSEEAIINAYKGWGFDERPVVTLQKTVGSGDAGGGSDPEAPADTPSSSEESVGADSQSEGGGVDSGDSDATGQQQKLLQV